MNITDFDPMSLQFSVMSELNESGICSEDGTPLLNVDYFVSATTPEGFRFWRHVGTFGWVNKTIDGHTFAHQMMTIPESFKMPPFGGNAEYLADVAWKLAESLHLSTTRRLNPDKWVFIGTVYGSDAYIQANEEETIAAQEREAERWG